jgi:hypothetical protein
MQPGVLIRVRISLLQEVNRIESGKTQAYPVANPSLLFSASDATGGMGGLENK